MNSFKGLVLCLALCVGGCAAEHGRIEGPPLYVHLCDAMPAADKDAWGAAAGDINLERGEPALWVGNGPPAGCDTVDVCPGAPLLELGECVVRVRYVDAGGARQAYESILEAL